MATRGARKEKQEARLLVEKRYEKHRRHNLVRAKPGDLKFVVVLDNLKPSFNIGKIFRSSDAFGACEVHLIGNHFFDPSPAMGSFKWVPVVYHDTFETCYENLSKRGYFLYVLEPEDGEFIHEARMPELSAFVMGHEEFGISFDKNQYPAIKTLKIKQLGKVQSLNVSVAASIVMYEYFRQHGAE